jgi:uncharacterized protein YwqG
MSFLSRLFRRKQAPPPDEERDIDSLIAPIAIPAIHAEATMAETSSQLGGEPRVPPGFSWPMRDGRPLAFLARIDLAQLRACSPIDWLPATGAVLFFYDVDEQPWGFDPKERDGWRVIYTQDSAGLVEAHPPATIAPSSRLPRMNLAFRRIRSFPSGERPQVEALELSDGEVDRFYTMQGEEFGTGPRHQFGGYPMPIQSDEMEIEAQLGSHGIYGGDQRDERFEALEQGASEWRLLFQVDSDEKLDVMWGDAGMLYFWIREAEAREGRFDRAWLVLQCY